MNKKLSEEEINRLMVWTFVRFILFMVLKWVVIVVLTAQSKDAMEKLLKQMTGEGTRD